MPFGSRISSLYMQRLANFISRALAAKGVIAVIYLDDALVICPRDSDPNDLFQIAISTVRQLGLPLAWHKVVAPATVIKFLGIVINLEDREISIPSEKIKKFGDLIEHVLSLKVITKKCLQSIIGHINFLSKAVPPRGCL